MNAIAKLVQGDIARMATSKAGEADTVDVERVRVVLSNGDLQVALLINGVWRDACYIDAEDGKHYDRELDAHTLRNAPTVHSWPLAHWSARVTPPSAW